MDNKDQALQPLMFIDQPTEHVTQSTMQQTYSSLHDQLPTYNEPSIIEKSRTINNKNDRRFNGNIMNTLDRVEEVQSEVEPLDTDKLKEKKEEQHFSDLTLEEKVIYCTSTSSYIPSIMCIIKTEKQIVMGVVRKYEEGIVHIKQRNSRVFIEIPLEEVVSIRMVGF